MVVVGVTALTAVVNDTYAMKELRGRPFWLQRLEPWPQLSKSMVCWPTYHPAAGLRSTAYKLKIHEDLMAFAEFRRDLLPFPGNCIKCGKEVDHWDDCGVAWCRDHSGKQLKLM